MSKINVGDVIKGKVMRLTNFGAFIDIGGVEGLMHASEFAWTRIEVPTDFFKIGEELDVKIIKIDGHKISLSLKALIDNPMEAVFGEFKIGDYVNCKILRHENFGSFVEIRQGMLKL